MIQGQATYFGGRSDDYAEALKYTGPALGTTSELTRQLVADDANFDRFLVDTSRAMGAIAERRDDLSQLVGNTNTTFGAIAAENQALGRTLEVLPGTLRKGNTTFVNLRSTLGDLDALVAASKPETKELPNFFRQLRLLTGESLPTVRDLRELIRLPGAGNDLIDLTARMPELEELTSHAFPRPIRTFDRSQDFVDTLRQYTPDLAALAKLGQVTNSYDANGHYARVQPMFTPFSANPDNGELTAARPPSAGPVPDQALRRCPGAATQAPPDGSAPFVVPGCNPAVEAGVMRRLLAIIALGLALPVLVVLGMGADGESGSGYEVRAIFDNVASAVPGEDVKVAGAKIGHSTPSPVNARSCDIAYSDSPAASRASSRLK